MLMPALTALPLKHSMLIQLYHIANAAVFHPDVRSCRGVSISPCMGMEHQHIERQSKWNFFFVILMSDKWSLGCIRWKSSKHWPPPHYGSRAGLHPTNKLFTTWPKWIIFFWPDPFISPSLQPAWWGCRKGTIASIWCQKPNKRTVWCRPTNDRSVFYYHSFNRLPLVAAHLIFFCINSAEYKLIEMFQPPLTVFLSFSLIIELKSTK